MPAYRVRHAVAAHIGLSRDGMLVDHVHGCIFTSGGACYRGCPGTFVPYGLDARHRGRLSFDRS